MVQENGKNSFPQVVAGIIYLTKTRFSILYKSQTMSIFCRIYFCCNTRPLHQICLDSDIG